MKRQAEDGYVLLTLLVLLLGIGAGWSGVITHNKQYGIAPDSISARDRRDLVNARQSMLSYAVLYPYLYGPTGAGPAHLPCPDTDGYRINRVEQQSAENQRRDGPNPPCASLAGSAGQLPRHVALPGYRYLFHSQSTQRYDYEVVGHMINNPLNRVVNLELLQAQAHQPVATIRLPSPIDSKVTAQVTITGIALARATVASVAAWVVQRSSRFTNEQCSLPVGNELTAQQVAEARPCHSQVVVSPRCETDRHLILVLDVPAVSNGDCLADSLELNTIDGVPALRHWFVRNEWYPSFKLTLGKECNAEKPWLSTCVLTFSTTSLKATIEYGNPIELNWIKSS